MDIKALKTAIDKRGIKYSAIAVHLGLSQPYVSQLLNGRRRMSVNQMNEIMKFTGVTVDEIHKSTD